MFFVGHILCGIFSPLHLYTWIPTPTRTYEHKCLNIHTYAHFHYSLSVQASKLCALLFLFLLSLFFILSFFWVNSLSLFLTSLLTFVLLCPNSFLSRKEALKEWEQVWKSWTNVLILRENSTSEVTAYLSYTRTHPHAFTNACSHTQIFSRTCTLKYSRTFVPHSYISHTLCLFLLSICLMIILCITWPTKIKRGAKSHIDIFIHLSDH